LFWTRKLSYDEDVRAQRLLLRSSSPVQEDARQPGEQGGRRENNYWKKGAVEEVNPWLLTPPFEQSWVLKNPFECVCVCVKCAWNVVV
jgi:hypothetical protein